MNIHRLLIFISGICFLVVLSMNCGDDNTDAPAAAVPDTTAPVLAVTYTGGNDTLFVDTLTITGTVSDAGGILSVTVNDSAAIIQDSAWSYHLVMTPGPNVVVITAYDLLCYGLCE
jgi:hypothetical protein